MDFSAELQAAFNEEFPDCFSVGPYNTISRTSTDLTESTGQQPCTPTSGRSTPAFCSMPMEQNEAEIYLGLTPPESTFGGYFPDQKQEPIHYMGFDNFAGSPSRRGSDDVGAVVQHQQPLPIPIESSDPLLLPRYPPPDQTTPPTLELPPAPYYYGNPTYDIPWMWPMDGPIQLFGGQDPPPTQGPAQNSHILPIPNPPAHQRPLCVDEVRQKSTALHKVQQYRVTKRKPAGPVFAYGREWPTLDKGKYECQWPGCKGKKRGFKRQEHLKRHENTVHLLLSHCRCPFCIAKPFNREDNFRTHVLLHTKKGGTSRTKYHPDAQAYLDMLNLKVKQRNHAEKRVRVEKRVARGRKAASRGITDHDHLSRLQTEAQYIMAPQDTMEPPPITV